MYENFFNYIFAVIFPFGQDGWKVLSLVSVIFAFKYFNLWKKDKIIISIFIFLIYGLILAIFSADIISNFEEIQNYFIGWLLPFLLGHAVIDDKNKTNILKIYIYTFSIIILISFLAYFNIIPYRLGYMTFIRDNRLAVLLAWHTVFGCKCGFIFAMLITLFIFKKNIDYSILILSVIFFIAILLSGTRSAYIGIFAAFVLMTGYYVYSRCLFKKIFTITFLFLTLFLLIYNTNPYLHERINKTSLTKEKSLTQRIEMYKFGINLISKSEYTKLLFGFGPSNSVKQDGNINNLGHFHNIYLQIFLDFGMIGFIFFILILFFILKKSICLYNQTKSNLFLMLIFAWIAILISELFDCTLRNQFFAGQCFWITGLVLGSTKTDKN